MINQKIVAELSYNPYTRTTEVKFNGKTPRINSLIEKYQGSILNDWVYEIPSIFHDEMNGFDFELEFSGTVMDYEEVKVAFQKAGVTEKQVRFFHKSVMEDRYKKIDRITKLFKWLSDNPNNKYDLGSFHESVRGMNNGSYQLELIDYEKSEQLSVDWPGVSIEVIEELSELDNTDLTHTPILIKVNQSDLTRMQTAFDYFARRNDVTQTQVFFIFAQGLNKDIATRTIQDLGVKSPRVIHHLNDELVNKYYLSYPVTDYIVEVIKTLKSELEELILRNKEENEKRENAYSDIHDKLRGLTDDIMKMKDADDALVYKDNLDVPSDYDNELEELYSTISTWRRKKTKITAESDADISATEYTKVILNAFNGFIDRIDRVTATAIEGIGFTIRSAYAIAEADSGFAADHILLREKPELIIPITRKDFLRIKEENYVIPKESGFLFKQAEERGPVLETVYYTQNWREYAINVVKPIAEGYLDDRYDSLCEYNANMTAAYHSQLQHMIEDKLMEREEIAQLLSDEEKQLERDNKWITYLAEQVELLERR